MQLLPRDLFDSVEFDKILDLLARECVGELAQTAARKLPVETSLALIERKLRQADEMRLGIENKETFDLTAYQDLTKDLRMLSVEDYVLPVEGLQRINRTLRLVGTIFEYFGKGGRKGTYPSLYAITKPIPYDEDLTRAIDRVIDEEGDIRPDASPELQKIRRNALARRREMDRVFKNLINDYRSRGWLTDNVESFRNGRRVLSVPAEHKRKIRGIIHDESSTGRTVFIEPEAVIDINNDIFDLLAEEKREIYRILKTLSATLRPYGETLARYQTLLVQFDLIRAKALLGGRMRGVMPKLKGEPHLGVQMGFHPLLYLKNKQTGRETVPFDLTLYGKNRVLVLSGPNAGGKSITMKAVGLLQLMVQSGMLVPVDEISEFGIFERMCADIGDQQSSEDDLSTYSSRLSNMKQFLDHADPKTLVLIDEFGSGTDPKIGGAIAEAILQELHRRQVFGVITTHYSNLKVYAFKTKGLVNGSMHFDKDTLSPTYELRVGRPGSSYAFEIAEKTGLGGKILKYARHRTGRNEKAVDQLLVDLQREKQELDERLDAARQQQENLERLVKNYEQLHRELEYRRKKIKLEAREQALQQTAQEDKELQRVIREIRETQNLEKAKRVAENQKRKRNRLEETVGDLREDIYYKPSEKNAVKAGEIKKGDFVKMRTGNTTGTVESVGKRKAIIAVGSLRMEVNLRDLEHANEPLELKKKKSVHTDTVKLTAAFTPRLDVRGLAPSEAIATVQRFVDQALMSNAQHLEIIHGKGTGALRKAVRKKLREYRAIMNITHPEPKYGGDGVTVVELE